MKQIEISKMPLEELQENLSKLKEEYIKLKMTHVVNPIENTASIRSLRRTIARVSTAISNSQNK